MAKHRTYAAINFIGLTAGLALALLIIAYIRSETNYDRFHTKADRIYRLAYATPNDLHLATSPPPIAPRMGDFFPEVELTARVFTRAVSVGLPGTSDVFEEDGVHFADSSLVDMFTFDFLHGNPTLALRDPFTVLLSEETATRYFGSGNPVGKTLLFNNAHAFKVAGVFRDYPDDAHIRFGMLVPYDNMYDLEPPAAAEIMRQNFEVNYVISHSFTYVLLKPGADPGQVNARMAAFIEKHAPPSLQVGQSFSLMPMLDIHLKSELMAEPSPTNSMENILIFAGVGLLTLIIACINYINLSTAQSLTRLREIGIRKILGSMKYQLILQFLAESFLFCLVSLLLAYGVFNTALPFLNEVTGKNLVFSEVVDGPMLLVSLALLITITALAGGYPAWFVARFDSINALKGQTTAAGGNHFMRRVLVVFQLMIACCLLTGSLLIMRQLAFLQDRPLGFSRDRVIAISLSSNNLNGIFRGPDSAFQQRLESFRHTIGTHSGVVTTTLSQGPPGMGAVYRGTIPEGFTAEDNLFVANLAIGYDFLDAYDMSLVAGRSFSRDFPSDATSAFLVNETAVRAFNWGTAREAIGKKINREGKEGQVVGVIGDFHFMSLTSPITAMVLEYDPAQFNTLSVRLVDDDTGAVLATLDEHWKNAFPEKAFEYRFLDDLLGDQYLRFRNFGLIIQSFTLVAILIACLGVYGLVLFVVQRRVREIGVRKVLGANVTQILMAIFRDFTALVFLGFLLAVPVSWWLLDQWLSHFTYRIPIDALTFFVSLIILAGIVFVTIGYQALRASLANPVESLRTE